MSASNKPVPIPSLEPAGPLATAWTRICESIDPQTEAEAAVVADQIRLTRGATPLVDTFLPFAAILVAYACRDWVPQINLFLWVGAVVLGCTTTTLAAYVTNPMLHGDPTKVRRAAQIRTAATIVFLAAWAGMGIALWAPGHPIDHILIVCVLAVTLAGTSSLLAAHPASVASGMAVVGGMLVLRPALSGTPLDLTMAGLGLVFTILMGGQVRVVYGMAKRARELEFERHKIIRDLSRAKADSDRDRAMAVDAGKARSEFLSNMNHELGRR